VRSRPSRALSGPSRPPSSSAWRALAENVTESLTKGAPAVVIGRLRMRSWETPEGEKRSVVEVEADEVGASLKFVTAKPERTKAKAAAGDTLDEVITAAERGIQRIRGSHHLAHSFLRHCGLSLW
jgi:single-stranded DNA-binding protein